MGSSKRSSKREVYNNAILPQKTRKTSSRQPNFTAKTTGKKGKKNSRRKEIIKIQAEINKKEMREAIVKINETKSWFFEKIKLTNVSQTYYRKKGEESNQQN